MMRCVLYRLALALILVSCSEKPVKLGDFKVLPLPQHFEISGSSHLGPNDIQGYYAENGEKLPVVGKVLANIKSVENAEKANLVFSIDPALEVGAEGYSLEVSEKRAVLKGKDEAGLFYGLKTLEQLLIDAQEQDVNLPQCTITDYPLLSYRAVHWDVKHHLEKTEYYYDLIDRLAGYKINGIILEFEDKLKYELRPTVGSADALSIAEWEKMSDYAKERHIEISPLVQGLGHASFILKHDEYKPLRDAPESDWAFNPLDPKTYEVQFDLYRDALKAAPHGKYLHVGGDEVHTTGRNSGISALELQLIWLNKVSDFAAENGRIPIFWDDMPLQQADLHDPMFMPEMTRQEVDSIWARNEHTLLKFLDLFPKNCIYMRWNYSHPETAGNTKAMEWFRENGLQVMGATAGQTRWVLMPNEESNMKNIKDFAKSSIESGLTGLLLTLWDDDSPHFELYIRGIVAFSEYTWTGEKRDKEAIKSAYRQREFSHALANGNSAFIDDLEGPTAFWKNALLEGNVRNYLKTMESPLENGVMQLPQKGNKGEWSAKYAQRLEQAAHYAEVCDSVSARIKRAKEQAVRNAYTLEVYEQVNQMAQFAPRTLLALAAYDAASDPRAEAVALESLRQLQSDFDSLRAQLETVYAKTRILEKPKDYILDQDHHVHLANQSLNFDWQFYAEILFFEKLSESGLLQGTGLPLN